MTPDNASNPELKSIAKEDIIDIEDEEETSEDVELDPVAHAQEITSEPSENITLSSDNMTEDAEKQVIEEENKARWWSVLCKIIKTPIELVKIYIIFPTVRKMFNFLANIVSKNNLSPNPLEFKSYSKDHEEQLLKLKSNLQNLLSLMEEEGEPLHSKKVQLVKDTIKGFDELCSKATIIRQLYRLQKTKLVILIQNSAKYFVNLHQKKNK